MAYYSVSDRRSAARQQAAHVIWGRVDTSLLDDSHGGNESSSSGLLRLRQQDDEIRYCEESSTSERNSQDSSSKAPSSVGAPLSSGQPHAPHEPESLPTGTGVDGSAPQVESDTALHSESDVLDGTDTDLAWEGLSLNEQADIVAIMTQTAEDKALPGELKEFWSKGSKAHGKGACKPCHYVHTSAGCQKGHDCKFCHIPHTRRGHTRPSQSQRLQCKRFAAALAQLDPAHAGGLKGLHKQMGSRSAYLRGLLKGQQQTAGSTVSTSGKRRQEHAMNILAAGINMTIPTHPPQTARSQIGSGSGSSGVQAAPPSDSGGAGRGKKHIVSL